VFFCWKLGRVYRQELPEGRRRPPYLPPPGFAHNLLLMNYWWKAWLWVSLLVAPAVAHAVALDQSREEVIAELGAPSGELTLGDQTTLVYPQGEVKLSRGKVIAHALMEEATLAERQAARDLRLARREAEGRELLNGLHAEEAFQQRPPAEKLRFWQQFAARYPMISVQAKITAAQAEMEMVRRAREAEQANEARLAELEERLTRTEEQIRTRRYSSRYDTYPFGRYPWDGPIKRRPEWRVQPKATVPADSMDRARADAMGSYEESRRRFYMRSQG